jgi:hypothetical protein
MVDELPIVKIDGEEYYMDARLREYRKKVELGELIEIKSFSQVFNSSKVVELVEPRKKHEYDFERKRDSVIKCLTSQEYHELQSLGVEDLLKNPKKLNKTKICYED